uniref:Fish-egg lectin-like n=1 Tax=Salarias fasciatus TaxID=181472 RepID=A0A672G780_SALFA
ILVPAQIPVERYTLCFHTLTCAHSGATQIDAGQGQVVMRNDKSEAFVLSGSTWTRLGSLPIRHISVGPAGIWGVDNNVYFHVFSGQNLNQVDAGGQDKIAGVTSSSTIHCLSAGASPLKEGDSLTWTTFPGALMYISCSSYGCWGVNSGQQIYFTKTDSCQIRGWTRVEGAAIMVEVGTDGTVFVVNVHGNLYQRTGISADVPHGTGWFQIPLSNNIKHASYDLGNLWLVINGGIIAKCSQ